MNKLFVSLLAVILLGLMPSVEAAPEMARSGEIVCSPELLRSLNAIQRVPEAKELIATIQKEGPIYVVARNTGLSNQFGAFWDPDRRIICVAISPDRTEADLIGSILFELQNAFVNAKFSHLDELAVQGKIDKASYVRSMEYIEYINSLNAAKIAEKGIQMGVLPFGSRLPTYRSFEEHFAIQRRSGHSACFAYNYDSMAPRSHHSQAY